MPYPWDDAAREAYETRAYAYEAKWHPWCDVSRNGIFLHRVGISEGADMLPFDATTEQRRAVLPEIHLIPDDPFTPDDADDPDDLVP